MSTKWCQNKSPDWGCLEARVVDCWQHYTLSRCVHSVHCELSVGVAQELQMVMQMCCDHHHHSIFILRCSCVHLSRGERKQSPAPCSSAEDGDLHTPGSLPSPAQPSPALISNIEFNISITAHPSPAQTAVSCLYLTGYLGSYVDLKGALDI